jgi:hypothetical protein
MAPKPRAGRATYRRLDGAWRSVTAITLSVRQVDEAGAANRHFPASGAFAFTLGARH